MRKKRGDWWSLHSSLYSTFSLYVRLFKGRFILRHVDAVPSNTVLFLNSSASGLNRTPSPLSLSLLIKHSDKPLRLTGESLSDKTKQLFYLNPKLRTPQAKQPIRADFLAHRCGQKYISYLRCSAAPNKEHQVNVVVSSTCFDARWGYGGQALHNSSPVWTWLSPHTGEGSSFTEWVLKQQISDACSGEWANKISISS